MIGFVYNGQVNYITRIEDFRDFMEPAVYEAMVKAFCDGLIDNYRQKYEDLQLEYNSLQNEYDELMDASDELTACEQELLDAEEKYELLQKSIRILIAQSYQNYIKQEDIIPTLERLI